MTTNQVHSARIFLVGDSDIERWPQSQLPTSIIGAESVLSSGHSGATLQEIFAHVESILEQESDHNDSQKLILIACAGENDVGEGIPLSQSESAFERLLDIVFNDDSSNHVENRFLIFLGPKFEPWMNDDLESRKQYVQMSKAFERCSKARNDNVIYLDCLTMFCCPKSVQLPGALLGGKAKPEWKYFESDQLHLSTHGYAIWKKIIEQQISEILANSS